MSLKSIWFAFDLINQCCQRARPAFSPPAAWPEGRGPSWPETDWTGAGEQSYGLTTNAGPTSRPSRPSTAQSTQSGPVRPVRPSPTCLAQSAQSSPVGPVQPSPTSPAQSDQSSPVRPVRPSPTSLVQSDQSGPVRPSPTREQKLDSSLGNLAI